MVHISDRNLLPQPPTVSIAHGEGAVSSARENPIPNGKKQRIGVLICGPPSMLHDTPDRRSAGTEADTWW
ncbi:hypothetical protein N7499_003262 [Penicillium canescens]|uniref:Uncharacterized protein n=1 Tax=Penicillium canescens TaxID=5083 RepID=A0AAD6N5J2_PENCN|nr:uncharacterized protein N7446_014024 [Penicillium canescens]KAJ6018543.1 hypothetical protein N7522_002007 [Penicillium canescens]KAJ6034149.1 hypothetical protein N7460_009966 [Penicillium canescens]KAJ6039276.1 hypothetical protein N7446_014024 [Penicillium canescens]KAJ6066125.1 hypothetical protein N7444_000254 [Penicillium canescens]KAJ6091111.1 hypothetical protein N7499_003262 [Penicillium canescens]